MIPPSNRPALVERGSADLDKSLPADGRWMAVSCAISCDGEILAVHHTVGGVTADKPRCLAAVPPCRRVQIRRLAREDAHEQYRGKADHLFGCVITGLAQHRSQPASNDEAGASGDLEIPWSSFGGQAELVVFARSEEDLNLLWGSLGPWLDPDSSHLQASERSLSASC